MKGELVRSNVEDNILNRFMELYIDRISHRVRARIWKRVRNSPIDDIVKRINVCLQRTRSMK